MARTKVCTGYDNNNQPIWAYEDDVLNPTAIDSIQVNGVTQPIVNKTVNLSIPSGGAFIVEFTENDDTYTANKTVKQIYDAFTEGKVVIGKYDKYVYYLTHCELSGSYYSARFTCSTSNDGAVESSTLYATEVSASSTTFEYTESIASEYAEGIMISDEGGYYSEESVEGALQEIGSTLNGLDTALANLL